MENIIFERNYENRDEDSFCSAVLEQALSGGFFEAYPLRRSLRSAARLPALQKQWQLRQQRDFIAVSSLKE